MIAALAAGVGVASPAVARTGDVRPAARFGLPATLAPGVRVWHESFTTRFGLPERASLLSIDLTRSRLRLDEYSAHGLLNGRYEPLSALVAESHALAGINGDFFQLGTASGVPDGGVVHDGEIWKSPRPNFNADLFVRANGTAGIGPEQFAGRLTTSSGSTRRIMSVNTLSNAAAGHATLVNSHLAGTSVPRGCTVVRGSERRGAKLLVTAVSRSVRWLPQLGGTQEALVGCGDAGRWLAGAVRSGRTLRVTAGFAGGPLRMLVSGEELLLENGRPFDDPDGHGVRGYHAETFACVSKSGRQVLLGTVDMGEWGTPAGITQPQLRYWLRQRGCWSAMSLDGGGSTEMAVHEPGTRRVHVVNTPADGTERAIPDGVFVFSR